MLTITLLNGRRLIVCCGVYISARQWRAQHCLQQPIRDIRRWRMRCGL